jgi:hypothetical protein
VSLLQAVTASAAAARTASDVIVLMDGFFGFRLWLLCVGNRSLLVLAKRSQRFVIRKVSIGLEPLQETPAADFHAAVGIFPGPHLDSAP